MFTMMRILLAAFFVTANAYQPYRSRLYAIPQPLQGFFDQFSPSITNNADEAADMKRNLLKKCEEGNRQEIENVIDQLKEVSPIQETAESDLLQKKWLLKWTTEKEINLFVDWGISSQVSQTICDDQLENSIEFKRGGSLGVTGKLWTEGGQRTFFEFTSATLDLAKWGSYKVPPIGKGWFDTVYLDSDLRVDCNSRNDILICTPLEE